MAVKVPVRFRKLVPEAIVPSYAHPGDAGADLYALEDTLITSDSTLAVRTGIAVEIPEGWEIQIRPRSGWRSVWGISSRILQGRSTAVIGTR